MKPLKPRYLRKLAARRSEPTVGFETCPRTAVSPTAWRPIDATAEPDAGPPPEAIFDRATGPMANRPVRFAFTKAHEA